MTKLEERKEQLLKQMKEKNTHCEMITCQEDQWYFLSNHEAYPILSIKIAIDDGDGLRSDYAYSADQTDWVRLFFIALLNEERELIIQDGNGLYSFGIHEFQSSAQAILICLRTEEKYIFIVGQQERCSAFRFNALPMELKDESTLIMDDIFSKQKISIPIDADDMISYE